MYKSAMLGISLLGIVALLSGCPPPEGWPKPPYDATGTYAGTWQGRTSDAKADAVQEIPVCPLTITLTQDLALPYPQDHGVKGTVNIDYSCLQDVLPEDIEQLPDSNVIVSGLLGDDGNLVLLSAACGTGACAVLTLAGAGEDADADGRMDTYSGQWSFIILLAGVQPFGVSGTFSVEAAP
jgi:hypothetical protein